jgi:beta-glucanase (GH16 family)
VLLNIVFAMFRWHRAGFPLLAFAGTVLAALATGAPTGAAIAAHNEKHLTWSDEFDGAAGTLPSPGTWNFDTGGNGWGNKELQYYTPPEAGNARLDGNGHLRITARKRRYSGPGGVSRNYTSARLQTINNFEFTYGLMEARIRVPKGAGLLPTFWALGRNAYDGPGSWPGSGEIDVMEVNGRDPRVLHGTIHGPWPWLRGGLGGQLRAGRPLSRGYHVYAVEWGPRRITFLLDGRPYRTLTPRNLRRGSAWPFQHPFFLLLNLSVGGRFAGRPTITTPFPATMSVDWVRVWQ